MINFWVWRAQNHGRLQARWLKSLCHWPRFFSAISCCYVEAARDSICRRLFFELVEKKLTQAAWLIRAGPCLSMHHHICVALIQVFFISWPVHWKSKIVSLRIGVDVGRCATSHQEHMLQWNVHSVERHKYCLHLNLIFVVKKLRKTVNFKTNIAQLATILFF